MRRLGLQQYCIVVIIYVSLNAGPVMSGIIQTDPYSWDIPQFLGIMIPGKVLYATKNKT